MAPMVRSRRRSARRASSCGGAGRPQWPAAVRAVIARTFAVVTAAVVLALAVPSVSSALTASNRVLALRFRPYLYFDSAERWRPIGVNRFLGEAGHRVCGAGGSTCVPLTSLSQLNTQAAYLDFRGSQLNGSDATAPDLATCQRTEPILRDCDENGRSVIYAHVSRTAAGIAVDYWWFLRYNALFPDFHEGDWEGVTVIADVAATHVLTVHFAAHADVWQYDRGVPLFDGLHVHVYVARGGHASYPRPCAQLACVQTGLPLPEGRYNGHDPWFDNDPAQCLQRCVRLFPETPAGAPASWDAWNGLWGAPRLPGFSPPRTPAFQTRYQQPFASQPSHRYRF
jgi:hypothetical protein